MIIDSIGMATFSIPVIGEALDIIWAPISRNLIILLYGDGLWSTVGFVEELLPFTDIIPSATLAWMTEHYGSKIKKAWRS